MTASSFKKGIVAAVALAATGCSGGGGSVASGTTGSPTTSAPSGAHRISAHVTIFIAKNRKVIDRRTRAYVSAHTQGVAIVTTTPDGSAVDRTAFSTNLDNPGCTAVSGGTSCTFTIGAVAPATTFSASTYDSEPSIPTGGAARVASGSLLSTGTAPSIAIAAGAANPVTLDLGGAVASYVLSTVANGVLNESGAVISFPGNGTPSATAIAITAFDADGGTIVAGASDPYVNPIAFTVVNVGAQSHTTLGLATASGGSAGQTTVTSTTSNEVLDVAYDGYAGSTGTSSAYYAIVTGTAAAATDTTTGNQAANTGVTSETLTVAPLFASAVVNNGDTFAVATAPPLFTYSNASNVETPSSIDALQEATPAGGAYSLTADAGNACTGVIESQATSVTAPFAATYDFGSPGAAAPTISSPCIYNLSDGFSTVSISVAYSSTTAGGGVSVPPQAIHVGGKGGNR